MELTLDEGDPADTISNAYSPMPAMPGALANAAEDFRSKIRYVCPEAYDRKIGNVVPIMVLFWTPPRLSALESATGDEVILVEMPTIWGEEEVTFRARVVPRRNSLVLVQDDGALGETGESSHEEFLRRLLDSEITGPGEVVIVLDWEGLGPVSFSYSLEGAAAAIREAGRPCGME